MRALERLGKKLQSMKFLVRWSAFSLVGVAGSPLYLHSFKSSRYYPLALLVPPIALQLIGLVLAMRVEQRNRLSSLPSVASAPQDYVEIDEENRDTGYGSDGP